ncbi:MAG: hypothetical protein AABX89_07260 [Candidatus Thermoplasmatota archaeon]
MPHAVILAATTMPSLGPQPLAREGGTLHKVAEVATLPEGWLLKSLIILPAGKLAFFTRVDKRPDGLVVRLDDHMPVERGPDVFQHLALIAKRLLAENPGSTLGPTNLADRIHA